LRRGDAANLHTELVTSEELSRRTDTLLDRYTEHFILGGGPVISNQVKKTRGIFVTKSPSLPSGTLNSGRTLQPNGVTRYGLIMTFAKLPPTPTESFANH
jgi:hypothetical protein